MTFFKHKIQANLLLVFWMIFIYLGNVESVTSGEFVGDLVLYPEGCQDTDARICKLGSLLTYKSSRDNLVWQTDTWKDGNGESGTTDGASIPKWAQSIVGDQYDQSYLKAAIVHDHYCYDENQVRTWRQTHRMFYDALIDLGIDKKKAKAMYFAVYLFGPHWVELVAGENCGQNCVMNISESGIRREGDSYSTDETQEEISKIKVMLDTNPDMSLEDIESEAIKSNPDYFFFNNGSKYTPSGIDDPNVNSFM